MVQALRNDVGTERADRINIAKPEYNASCVFSHYLLASRRTYGSAIGSTPVVISVANGVQRERIHSIIMHA